MINGQDSADGDGDLVTEQLEQLAVHRRKYFAPAAASEHLSFAAGTSSESSSKLFTGVPTPGSTQTATNGAAGHVPPAAAQPTSAASQQQQQQQQAPLARPKSAARATLAFGVSLKELEQQQRRAQQEHEAERLKRAQQHARTASHTTAQPAAGAPTGSSVTGGSSKHGSGGQSKTIVPPIPSFASLHPERSTPEPSPIPVTSKPDSTAPSATAAVGHRTTPSTATAAPHAETTASAKAPATSSSTAAGVEAPTVNGADLKNMSSNIARFFAEEERRKAERAERKR